MIGDLFCDGGDYNTEEVSGDAKSVGDVGRLIAYLHVNHLFAHKMLLVLSFLTHSVDMMDTTVKISI